jgi:uncharacterized membrane protein (DUF2068 family)
MTGEPAIEKKTHAAALRTIASYEAAKGALVLLAGMGLLELIHRDVQGFGEHLLRHFHLSPSSHYPRIFLELAAKLTDGWLWTLAAASLLYSGLRFSEAYGLWRGRRWAEWLGAASGAVYVPFEVVELFKKATALRAGSLILNLLIVGYLAQVLRRRSQS